MKRLYITFSGAAYNETTARIVQDGCRFGADKVLVYDDAWLMDQEFYRLNKWLWTYPDTDDPRRAPRGFGWFCWKPFIIMHALERCEPGDVVLYTDADTFPIEDFSVLYHECDRIGGTMLFAAQGCGHVNWCKEDCFIVMGDWAHFHNPQHGVARFMNPLATTFDRSVLRTDSPLLHEHRTEQAIMTNLAHKYGHKLYREACQFGATQPEDQELYPQLFEQVGCHAYVKSLEGSAYRNV